MSILKDIRGFIKEATSCPFSVLPIPEPFRRNCAFCGRQTTANRCEGCGAPKSGLDTTHVHRAQ